MSTLEPRYRAGVMTQKDGTASRTSYINVLTVTFSEPAHMIVVGDLLSPIDGSHAVDVMLAAGWRLVTLLFWLFCP